MSLKKNYKFDSSLEVLTPEGIGYSLSCAGLPVRTLAYAIDAVIQGIILIAASVIWGVFLRWQFGIWIFLILNFCIDWFYHIFFELAFRGQSPGKKITGIRVVKSDGSPVDASASFMRNLLRFADTFCYLYLIAFLSMSVSSGFRRLGDWAGNTVVVYARKGAFPAMYYAVNYPPVVPPVRLSNEEKQAILNFAQRYPLLGKARADEIACVYAKHLRDDAADASITDAAYLLGIASYLSGSHNMGGCYDRD